MSGTTHSAATIKAFLANPKDPRHGSVNGYGNLGCRCSRCKSAKARQSAELAERRRAAAKEAERVAKLPGRGYGATASPLPERGQTVRLRVPPILGERRIGRPETGETETGQTGHEGGETDDNGRTKRYGTRWRPVGEPPIVPAQYMVWLEGEYAFGFFLKKAGWLTDDGVSISPTHWRALPSAPQDL